MSNKNIINIDELALKECQPIEVIVGGKTYTVDDISLDVMEQMQEVGAGPDKDSVSRLVNVMAEILGAEPVELRKLGMRKFVLLIGRVMDLVNENAAAKNVPGELALPTP